MNDQSPTTPQQQVEETLTALRLMLEEHNTVTHLMEGERAGLLSEQTDERVREAAMRPESVTAWERIMQARAKKTGHLQQAIRIIEGAQRVAEAMDQDAIFNDELTPPERERLWDWVKDLRGGTTDAQLPE